MPRRRREKGIVNVVIGPGEQAPKPFEGFDLDEIALSDAELMLLTFRYFNLDPKIRSDRQRLRRTLSKKVRRPKGGRKSDDLAFALEMREAGVTETDTAPVAAQKIANRRKQRAGIDGLVQKIRLHRRKERDVIKGWQKLGG